jgi:hypothetical protein
MKNRITAAMLVTNAFRLILARRSIKPGSSRISGMQSAGIAWMNFLNRKISKELLSIG